MKLGRFKIVWLVHRSLFRQAASWAY